MNALRDLFASIGVMCIAFTIVAVITIGIQELRMRRARRLFDAHVAQAELMASRRRHPSARVAEGFYRADIQAQMRREINAAKARADYFADELMP